MRDACHVIAYDVGTTGAKACLYRFHDPSRPAELLASAASEYRLRLLPGGGAEQDPGDWWSGLCAATRTILGSRGVPPAAVQGIAFCCQMQGLVLVDADGTPVRPAMTYMDQRAVEQKRRGIERGLRVAGMNARKLLPSLILAGGVSASAKDPVWKYHWVRDNEPEAFRRVFRWLDGKEYLVHRCTGRFCMTPDSAHATFLFDTRPGHCAWSPTLCRLFDVDPGHLPEVRKPAEQVGPLLPAAASDLGLCAGTPVFGGGGDLSLVGLGSGAVALHDTHLYMGTSGWVSTVTDRRIVDTDRFIASIMGARPGLYNYISEQETSGKCLEWARDHLGRDEIGASYDLLGRTIDQAPAGAGGVLFAPWLRGNRSPFEDPHARGVFFNIGLETTRAAMVRAVVEGIALHNRWQLESIRRKVPAHGPLRFVGGGARTAATARVMADVLGEPVQTIASPQNVGALGAAVLCAAGLGVISSLEEAGRLVPVDATWEPRPEHRETYDLHFAELKNLYRRNRAGFRALNRIHAGA